MQTFIPQEQLQNLPNLYDTENDKDPLCHIKLFTPDSNFTWYIIEISQKDSNTCFGLVSGHDIELGYFTLSELSSVRGPLNLPIELDSSFSPTPLSEVKKFHS